MFSNRTLLFSTLFLVGAGLPARAQLFSFGVKGGGQLTDAFDVKSAQVDDNHFVIGPMAEIVLPLTGLRLEGDILYRRDGFTTTAEKVHSNVWEFPLIVKYSLLPLPLIKPYIGAGWAPRVTSLTARSTDVSHGIVLTAGVSIGLTRVRVAPELRYTRWTSSPVNGVGSLGSFVTSARNQADVLVGITF